MRITYSFIRNSDGAALVEFALVLPALLLMLSGTIEYSYWFYMSNSIQAVANDAARASLAGLSATERASLANSTVNADLTSIGGFNPANATVAITDNGQSFNIRVNYDASNSPFVNLGPLPAPPQQLTRSAVVSLQSF